MGRRPSRREGRGWKGWRSKGGADLGCFICGISGFRDVDFPCSFFTMSFEVQDTLGLLKFSFTQIPLLV